MVRVQDGETVCGARDKDGQKNPDISADTQTSDTPIRTCIHVYITEQNIPCESLLNADQETRRRKMGCLWNSEIRNSARDCLETVWTSHENHIPLTQQTGNLLRTSFSQSSEQTVTLIERSFLNVTLITFKCSLKSSHNVWRMIQMECSLFC